MITAKSVKVSNKTRESHKYGSWYVLGLAKSVKVSNKAWSLIMAPGMFEARIATIIILAFYFSDPFPMFLVRDHFSCKYAPRIKAACS